MKLNFKSSFKEDSPVHVYDLNSKEDFHLLVEVFPQVEESLYKYSDIELIAEDIVAYLSSHHMTAWLSSE